MPTANTSSYLARFRQRALEGQSNDEGKASGKRKQKKTANIEADGKERLEYQTEQRDNNDSQESRQIIDIQREENDVGPLNDNSLLEKQTGKSSKVLDKIMKNALNQKNQMKVMYNQFGANPRNVIHVEKEDSIPSPDSPDQVIVKILVRVPYTKRDAFGRMMHICYSFFVSKGFTKFVSLFYCDHYYAVGFYSIDTRLFRSKRV
jgi:hypothetical protein